MRRSDRPERLGTPRSMSMTSIFVGPGAPSAGRSPCGAPRSGVRTAASRVRRSRPPPASRCPATRLNVPEVSQEDCRSPRREHRPALASAAPVSDHHSPFGPIGRLKGRAVSDAADVPASHPHTPHPSRVVTQIHASSRRPCGSPRRRTPSAGSPLAVHSSFIVPGAADPGTSAPITVRFATARLVAEPVDGCRLAAMAGVLADAIVHEFLNSERRCQVQHHLRQMVDDRPATPPAGSWLLRLRHAACVEPIGSAEVWLDAGPRARIVCLVHPSHQDDGYEEELTEGLLGHLGSCRPVREAMLHINRRRGLREEFERWMDDLVSIGDRSSTSDRRRQRAGESPA